MLQILIIFEVDCKCLRELVRKSDPPKIVDDLLIFILFPVDIMLLYSLLAESDLERWHLLFVGFPHVLNYWILVVVEDFWVLQHREFFYLLDTVNVVIGVHKALQLEFTIHCEALLVNGVHGQPCEKCFSCSLRILVAVGPLLRDRVIIVDYPFDLLLRSPGRVAFLIEELLVLFIRFRWIRRRLRPQVDLREAQILGVLLPVLQQLLVVLVPLILHLGGLARIQEVTAFDAVAEGQVGQGAIHRRIVVMLDRLRVLD
jgi:hypothetical protein